MGQSTNGQLHFGIVFEEGFEFPWDGKYEGDYDEWWLREIQGYKNPVELYDKSGNWINGIKPSKEKEDEYYDTRRDFKNNNPEFPLKVINYCSCDYPMWILAVKEVGTSASRGYPTEINPDDLVIGDEWADKIYNFCNKHGIEYNESAKWWLSSLWC